MKIKFVRNFACDVVDRHDERYSRHFLKDTVVFVERIEDYGNFSNLATENGEIFLDVPKSSFTVL